MEITEGQRINGLLRESQRREKLRQNRRKTEEREEVRLIASVLDLGLSDAAQ